MDLLQFAKLLELLAIDHSSSGRRIIFAPRLLKFCHVLVALQLLWVHPCSGCFITCMDAHFHTVKFDNTIRFSILSRMSGFLWHSSKWTCQFGNFFQYTSGLEVLACSLDTDVNYVTTMLQLCLSLNH